MMMLLPHASRLALGLIASAAIFWPAAGQPAARVRTAASAQEPERMASGLDTSGLDTSLYAAGAGSVRVGWGELDRVLLDKYASGQSGRDALAHLLRARVLEDLARSSKLVIKDQEVRERLAELEQQIVVAGEAQDLEDYLSKRRISIDTITEFMRLGIVQERLAARALGRRPGEPITGEEQEMWLDQVLLERGIDYPQPPWKDGVVASCGGLSVYVGEYARHLRQVLPTEDLQDACRHLVLVARMRQLMPDLSAAAEQRAVSEELDRRRAVVRENPAYGGLTYDQIAAQRGVLPSALERDPEIVATALSHIWIDRKYSEEKLRELYRDRRAFFDTRYGEALDVYLLFLNAAKHRNPLIQRTFSEARGELTALLPQLADLESFQGAVASFSEHSDSKAERGALGWITRHGDKPEDTTLRSALFAHHSGGLSAEHRLVGPIELPGGVALVWVEGWRAKPDWSGMRELVHRELRRIFVREVLPSDKLATYLDSPD